VQQFAHAWTLAAVLGSFILAAGCGAGAGTSQPAATVAPASSATSPPTAPPLTADAIQAILAASDRTNADRKLDATRHPDKLLAFLGVGPGMKVADLGAGGGYTTELLARAVGPNGKAYSQNEPDLVKRFMEKPWSARLALPANKGVVRLDRPLDDPFPPEATNLDLVADLIGPSFARGGPPREAGVLGGPNPPAAWRTSRGGCSGLRTEKPPGEPESRL
jgi:hypothetical protein